MNSRMERYIEKEEPTLSRENKNQELYNTIQSLELTNIRTSNNIRVIESNEKNIDIEKIKKYINSLNEEKPTKRRTLGIYDQNEEPRSVEEETRDYDINSILEKAKQEREIDYDSERYKKLRDTQYDILSKLGINEEEKKEEVIEEEFNTDEKTLIDLINTVTIHKNETGLLDELKDTSKLNKKEDKDTIKEEIKTLIEEKKKETEEVKEEPIKNENISNIDKSFYTNSMSFSKEDFEGFEELEKSVKKNNVLSIISIVVLFIAIIITLFVIANYVFELNIF